MVGTICRLWWPKPLLHRCDLLLFGWLFGSGSASLDVVVAGGICPRKISPDSDLHEVLGLANREMPTSLLSRSKLSIVGYLAADFMSNGSSSLRISHTNLKFSACGCVELDKMVDLHRQHSVVAGRWIQLVSSNDPLSRKEDLGTPKLHHVHENGTVISIHHLHVILYEPPKFGRHHFSLNCWNSSMQECGISLRMPSWICELQKKRSVLDMEDIILSINASYTADRLLTGHLEMDIHSISCQRRFIFTMVLWHFVSACAASASTLVYIALQLCHNLLYSGSKPLICFSASIATAFPHVWLNVNVHCSQFLYWPVILQGSSSRLHSNVEYMHKVELRKHALWSNIIFDGVLGFILGLFLLMHAQIICDGVVAFSGQVTNSLLRSGCVWLMGVPAGFKLNTELAELLGIVSLHAIQIWSTIWFSVGSALPFAVIALAFSGMLLGLTVLLALCIDILKLVTMHISVLHWFVSLIYSQQIQALSSLWRLFRGRKWNPLRKRLDSFDYTVEEHVVGSLLFTPILLLLPTTSVFYIFLTILSSFISFTCILIEIMISLLHATPYAEVLMWMLRKGRFPSGIWFEILPTCDSRSMARHVSACHHPPSSLSTLDKNISHSGETSILVSVLHSNYASIGQILMLNFRKVFIGVSMSSSSSSFYGILSGQRIPSTLQTGMPSTFPWINLSFLDYWCLCHDSILEYGLHNA